MTNEDDVLPQSEKARAIVLALDTLRQAGIEATLDIEVGAASPYSIILPITSGTEGMRLAIAIALHHEWQARTADLAVQTAKQGNKHA